eukprot:TRINITY_DN4106_c0_g2_i1.p1 TRINITY_DN4106_c0_g2~~TRINITY_DN4106_c0_g2_i1.p1  ORF type:complete len:340 (-),score=31.46 TRINITY_DN4106_c0_g2_i1:862-1860(-)
MSLMHALAMQRLRGDSDLRNLSFGSFVDTPEPPPVDPAYIEEWIKVRGLKSYLILRVREHHYEKYWRAVPLPVIGGLNKVELALLSDCEAPVFLVFCWLHRQLVERRRKGGLKEDAPIVSRIYQVLSDGMLGYENARKLCDTPFPFPYAQCVALLLHLNAVGMPLLMANWIGQVWLAALTTFFSVFTFYVINEVAREIEEPFRFDPNDIPVANYQHRFNARLVIALLRSCLPVANSSTGSDGGPFHHIKAAELQPFFNKVQPNLQSILLSGPSSSRVKGINNSGAVSVSRAPSMGVFKGSNVNEQELLEREQSSSHLWPPESPDHVLRNCTI